MLVACRSLTGCLFGVRCVDTQADAYSVGMVKRMELEVLKCLNYKVSFPVPIDFVETWCDVARKYTLSSITQQVWAPAHRMWPR